jgi:spore germination protein
MEIYVVQPNDTIEMIARKYNVPTYKLIRDNELQVPVKLATGQNIVIAKPTKTYAVKADDTIESIARKNGISQMKLLQNNPFLSTSPIYEGEVLNISYPTTGKTTTNGFIFPYINKDILKKTLPNLTYLTVYNYRTIEAGKVISYMDESEIIQIAKDYGTIPLLMATTLSSQGELNLDIAYTMLLSEEVQDSSIQEVLTILKDKGYLGVNLVFHYINYSNLYLHERFVKKISKIAEEEGYWLFVTIYPNLRFNSSDLTYNKIDYSNIYQVVNGISFLQFIWGTNYGPPLPANSIEKLSNFIEPVIAAISPNQISIGNSLISYDWQLPYIPGSSYANALSINSALRLAQDIGAEIKFDDVSKAPYFFYLEDNLREHIVWSVDARTIDALMKLITQYSLEGASFWNLMTFTAQLWLVINSQYEIEKRIPNQFD